MEDAAARYVFSEYPLDHPLYSAMNRKAIRVFIDELKLGPMQQFVGLRPKYYAFLCAGKVSNTCKIWQRVWRSHKVRHTYGECSTLLNEYGGELNPQEIVENALVYIVRRRPR